MRTLLLLAILVAAVAPASLFAASPASKSEVARYAQQLLSDNYAADGPGAAVLVARGDEVLFRGARGRSNVQAGTPLTADDMFEIGSITKQFTAAGLLKLVEAGKVALDDPLSKYVKDYPNGDRITVLELLNHTSGIKDYTDIPRLGDEVRPDMTTRQLIDAFKNEKADFAPGTSWAYDNSGYVLAAAVIEAASGMPWYAYLQKTLFAPLGLTHTSADSVTAAKQVQGDILLNGKPAPAKLIKSTHAFGDGALVASNVDDLLKWNRALHEGRVLKSETYRQMVTPVGKAVPAKYGLGMFNDTLRGMQMLQHGGDTYGSSGFLLYLPREQLTVVVLYKLGYDDSVALGVADVVSMARQLAAHAISRPYPEKKPIPVDIATLRQYEGVYRADKDTVRVLRVIDGKLTSQRTGSPRLTLVPVAKDVFLFAGKGILSRMAFERNSAGTISAMRFFPKDDDDANVVPRTEESMPAR